jgi:hypothetical protein
MPQPTDRDPKLARCFEAALAVDESGADKALRPAKLIGTELVRRPSWANPEGSGLAWAVALSMDPEACDMTRLAAGVPVTAGHIWSNSDVIASIGSTVAGSERMEAGEGVFADIQFCDESDVSEAYLPVLRQFRKGILRALSIQIGNWSLVRAPELDADGVQGFRAEKWTIESVAGVIAGASASAMAFESIEPGREPENNKEAEMPEHTVTTEQLAAEKQAAATQATEAERTRVREITALGASASLADEARLAIDEGKTFADFQAQALAALVEREKKDGVKTTNGTAHVAVATDAGDHVLEGVAQCLAAKIDPQCAIGEEGKRYAHMSALRLAGQFLSVHGVNVAGLSDNEILRRAMTRTAKAYAQTTSDFPALVASGFNRSLSRGFAQAARTFQPWTEAITVEDFQGFDVIGLDDVPALQTVVEGAPYPLVALTDKKETGTITKSGNRVSLTWEAIKGDRLGAFQQIMARQRYRALMLEETTVYGVLDANAAMRDSVALFHADHGNLAGASAISPTSVAELQGFVAAQTDQNGALLGLRGRYLLCGYGTKVKWDQYLSDAYKPTSAANAVSADMRGLVVIDSPASLGTKFYVIAEPMAGGTVTVARLAGYEAPTVEEIERPENDSIEYKVRHVFGAKSAEWRTMAYNPGA